MGEVPIYSSKAHVFVIDPVTKKSWIPASKAAATVNFFFDSTRKSYRIISVEGSKAIINSTVTSEMAFTKTSAKFGQWADIRANTVYGLGFSTDILLSKFTEQFEDIRDRARELSENSETTVTSNGHNDQDNEKPTTNSTKEDVSGGHDYDEELFSSASDDSRNNFLSSELRNLRLQNERLKLAVTQSSANSKKSETELQALKSTNTRLTTALQESMSNVDQWHRQLAMYKEDNEQLKKQLSDTKFEKIKEAEYLDQIDGLKKQLEQLQIELSEKSQECNMLQQRVGVLNVVEKQHNECAVRIKKSYDEVHQLKEKLATVEEKSVQAAREKSRKQLEGQHLLGELANYLTDITAVTQKLQSTL
uniref:Homer protein homolog 2 n=1 Tax=Phallusia mammillata TaxID=59560 RepID=A0A6F9DDZ3_9ASCI|nr:homer protein homolog 2 [Phallusia mammillata]